MRDITRGGLATVLAELAQTISFPLLVEEEKIPCSTRLQGAVEILGIDPLYLACEGRALMVVPARKADEILKKLRSWPAGRRFARNSDWLLTSARASDFRASSQNLLNLITF
jgi:hydrogenase expression/formation protein HypE